MKYSIENYVPQALVQKHSRQAIFAWGAISLWAFIWIFLIISAPIAKANGFENFADSIYTFFGYLCHQMSWRAYYFSDYPFAVCARCFGFYGGFFLGLAVYPLFRSVGNTEASARTWLFLAMIPMAVDWSLGFFGIWDNTHLSRFFSGGILGTACAFYLVPAVVEINYFLCEKFQRD